MGETYQLTHVLKAYSNRSQSYESYGGVYLEVHKVRQVNGENTLGPGSPITAKAYNQLMQASSSNMDLKRFRTPIIDPRVISYNPDPIMEYVCWWEPAQKRKIIVSQNKEVEYNIWMPAILYHASNGVLRIFALKTNKRPTMGTELYGYPLPNLKSEAEFCTGNVKVDKLVDKENFSDIIYGWQKFVWASAFDGYNGSTHIRIFKELKKSGKRYPKKELKSLGKTVQHLF